jgi:hypothetical protein
MNRRFEQRPSDDPWGGRQPRYEAIVRLGPMRFGLKTRLPDGRPIVCELGPRLPKRRA